MSIGFMAQKRGYLHEEMVADTKAKTLFVVSAYIGPQDIKKDPRNSLMPIAPAQRPKTILRRIPLIVYPKAAKMSMVNL